MTMRGQQEQGPPNVVAKLNVITYIQHFTCHTVNAVKTLAMIITMIKAAIGIMVRSQSSTSLTQNETLALLFLFTRLPWASHLASLRLSFPIYKVRVINVLISRVQLFYADLNINRCGWVGGKQKKRKNRKRKISFEITVYYSSLESFNAPNKGLRALNKSCSKATLLMLHSSHVSPNYVI